MRLYDALDSYVAFSHYYWGWLCGGGPDEHHFRYVAVWAALGTLDTQRFVAFAFLWLKNVLVVS